MLIINRKLSHKGFSLIELMIAVVILAIALLGIFQAYSVGFMGMADARDRTVATNYLREMIEDFKNMDFNKVKDEPITLIPGTKFRRGAIVLDLEKKDSVTNLKKVITQVRWIDRKGEIKIEEASTILYNTPNTSEVSNAAGIMLYATPYYTILPNHEVKLTAEIKDENGNIITDWVGDITFSVIDPNDPDNTSYIPVVGDITTIQSVHTTNGIASSVFLAVEGESVEGIEKIQASAILDVVGAVTDTVNIRVSTGAVGIILEPDVGHEILPVEEIATINLYVVRASYEIDDKIAYSGDITLNTSGPGSLSTTTINGVPDGYTTLNLTSTGTPGVVEITASAPDLDMGYTEVTFTGEPESIIVSSKKRSIYPGDETLITVTVVDKNNKPVSFGTSDIPKTVIITDNPDDYGTLDNNEGSINLVFTGESSNTCVFKASSTGEFPQEITITANDNEGELNSGSTNIEILSTLIPHHIDVTYDPSIIKIVDGVVQEPSVINAIIKSKDGDIVYGQSIIFETSLGTFSSTGANSTTLTGGLATASLYPPDNLSETAAAEIKVYSNDILYDSECPPGHFNNPVIIEVLFHIMSDPDKIQLIVNPQNIYIGGDTCIITATIVDESGITYTDYNGRVEFSIENIQGSVTFGDLIVTALNGVAEINLQSTTTPGEITVQAKTLDLDNNLISNPETITVKEITLILVDGSIYYWLGFKIITFNIEIDGPNLNLINMEIVWNKDDSFLNEIGIKTPSTDTSYDRIIDTGNGSSHYTENDINQVLSSGESTIRLTFSKNIKNVPIKVTFYINFGEYSGEHIVEF